MNGLFTRLGFWLVLPVSAAQGLRLRRTALRLPEAEGDRSGVCGAGGELHLLAIGDSIIAGVGTGSMPRSLPVQFASALSDTLKRRVVWHADGANGADILDLRRRLGQMPRDRRADVILISIGVNDVTGLSSTRHWRSQLQLLCGEIRARWPRASVIFAGLPPMGRFPLPPQPLRFTLGQRAATLDTLAAEFISGQAGMLHIATDIDPLRHDFCADGFHPSAQSCASWARELAHRFIARVPADFSPASKEAEG